MKSIIAMLIWLLLLHSIGYTQALEKGSLAPEIKLSEVFQGPEKGEISLQKLRGKVVVLEFWATWCAPCISAFPHINKLVDDFKGKDVAFISISVDEAPDANRKIKSLLVRNPLHSWVVKDDITFSTMKSYAADALPKTILIDPRGMIYAVTTPEKLTTELLNQVLKEGVSVAIPPVKPVLLGKPAETNAPVLAPLSITVTESGRAGTSMGYNVNSGLGIVGATADKIVQWLFDVPAMAVIPEDSLHQKWDVKITCPKGLGPEIKNSLRKAVVTSIGVSLREERRYVDVYVLKCPNGPKIGVKAELTKTDLPGSLHMSSSGNGDIAATKASFPDILRMLQNSQGFSMLDETGLKGKYDISIKFKEGDLASFTESIKDAGLELVKEKRSLNVYLISALNK